MMGKVKLFDLDIIKMIRVTHLITKCLFLFLIIMYILVKIGHYYSVFTSFICLFIML
jgi:hypothetical protein